MYRDLAVVMDVAGTILKMYRVAKDIERGTILEGVITWKLIIKNKGRALVVPQMDPEVLCCFRADDSLGKVIAGREEMLAISCSSSPISREDAIDIILRTQARIGDLMDVHSRVKARCPGNYHTAGMIIDVSCREVVYAISTGGVPFAGMKEVICDLNRMGADIFVASGDSMRSLSGLQDLGISLSQIYPVSSPIKKREIVEDLKKRYRRVIMVGDGLNDIYALQSADLGVLTIQQETHPAKELLSSADEIIKDIRQLPQVVRRNS
ncbi:MAG TPA: HAD family hydrolase [Methanothrix sp.]|nr:HAD family hydrolase [Methanothrix sp.]